MRRFSRAQKLAAELVSGRTGEADHIYPYAKGGPTTVENCQIMDANTNKRKGSFGFNPRKWQQEFLDRWRNRSAAARFMLIAIPGSGKTMAALETARQWMAAGSDRRLVVVVPSVNLRNQWQHEAGFFGMELQTKEFTGHLKHGFQGCVVTYHFVAINPHVFRKLCSVAPTMVIFDEIHHCGDESHFGIGIKEAFELAKEIICMSGTPWKTDGSPIPFVRYDGDGFALADFRYDYPDALTDEVVRYLVFVHARGTITNDLTGERFELSQEVSDDEAAARLSRLLDADGEYVRQQISDAHRKLMECRKTVPDAAAMALCIDQVHATKVARVIADVTGCSPSIIVSDEQIENDSVDSFRRGTKEWLVSVRKVSEGTDIKRLQVLCYLTNVVSELFFRQAIGRVSRVRGLEDYEGYVYLPADPRLIRCSQNIDNAQVVALREQAERESRQLEQSARQNNLFTTWTTQHTGNDKVVINGVAVPIGEAGEIERIAETVGLSMQKVMEVRALLGASSVTDRQAPEADAPVVSLEEQLDEWRKKCNKMANRLARLKGVEVKDIHTRYLQQFGPQKDMSLLELQAKYRALVEEIREC